MLVPLYGPKSSEVLKKAGAIITTIINPEPPPNTRDMILRKALPPRYDGVVTYVK